MRREYGIVLQDIISDGSYGRSFGGGVSRGNTSSQIIRGNNIKIKELEKRVKELEMELEEARRPSQKYYCKVKD